MLVEPLWPSGSICINHAERLKHIQWWMSVILNKTGTHPHPTPPTHKYPPVWLLCLVLHFYMSLWSLYASFCPSVGFSLRLLDLWGWVSWLLYFAPKTSAQNIRGLNKYLLTEWMDEWMSLLWGISENIIFRYLYHCLRCPMGWNNTLTQNCELSSGFLRDEAVFSSLVWLFPNQCLVFLPVEFPSDTSHLYQEDIVKGKIGRS